MHCAPNTYHLKFVTITRDVFKSVFKLSNMGRVLASVEYVEFRYQIIGRF